MNALTTTNTFEDRQIRTHVKDDGSIWFITQDVMEVLGLKYQAHALRKLQEDERGGVTLQGNGGNREFSIVSESGLYTLILCSKKASALKFKSWVTREVLPSIRKTGQFTMKEMTPAEKLYAYAEAALRNERAISAMGDQLKTVAIEAKQDHDTLDHDQIKELTELMTKRYKELGLKDMKHHGLMKKAIKDSCFGRGFRTVATFKDIPRRDFHKACEIIDGYTGK